MMAAIEPLASGRSRAGWTAHSAGRKSSASYCLERVALIASAWTQTTLDPAH